MNRYRNVACWFLIGMLGLGLAGPVPPTPSAEPAAEFLQALRERGYHDAALDYLERLKTSALVPAEFREVLLYEIGTTLIDASRTQRDLTLREKQLDEARDALTRFVGQSSAHPLASAANSQLGNMLVERARIKIEQSKKPKADKATLLADARKIYDDAYKVFVRSQNDLKEKLAKMKAIDPDEKKDTEVRDRFRADYLQAQLLAAAIKEETADTAQKGTEDYKTLLGTAAKEYAEIYDKYRTRLAGLYARMYQGRCQLKLDNCKDALALFGELLEQPDNPDEFRRLKMAVLMLAAEAWAKNKPPLWTEAVTRLQPFVDGARPNEEKEETWIKLRMELAKAQWALKEELKAKNPKDPQLRKLETDARKNILFVSKQTGDWQQEARQLLADWGGPKIEEGAKPEPRTFAEARQAGRDALEAMQTANMVLNTLPGRIEKEQDAAVKADLQKQLAEAKETIGAALADAKRYFRLALHLARRDSEVKLDDVNVVRYFLCFLYYTTGDYYEAALMGEFLAKRYPSSSGARESAKIAMAAYVKLYSDNKSEDKAFESRHIVAICNYITQKWPDQPEAVEALNTLIPFMIREGKLDDAERYLQGIPVDSPKRGDAEIKTGQAMWGAYLRGMQEIRGWEADQATIPAGVDVAAKKASLEQLKARAQKVLMDGVSRMAQAATVSESLAVAALSLAQIFVDTDQTAKAVALLEDPRVGPLVLVQKEDPATAREGYAGETYKTALRAYISSLAGAANSDAIMKKADAVMDAMKKAIPDDKRIPMYVSLARDLEEQMKLATPQAKAALSKGFEGFLIRIRGGTTEFPVLNWIAETFSSIGASFFEAEQRLTADAKKHYDEAAATYKTILDKVTFEDPRLKTQVMLRYALTQRRLGGFTEAKKVYLEILQQNAMMVNVQIEAAKMYQEWAAYPGKEALYDRAIKGAEPNPKTQSNFIWGWAHMGNVTAKNPKFRDTFHEARYSLAVCRYNQGKTQKSKTDQNTFFEKAKQDILRTMQLYGTGPEWENWKPKYDALMRNIQKSLGEKPTGLPPQAVPAGATPAPAGPAQPAAGTAPAAKAA